jgi:UMF1 family MFS transporter
MAWPVVREGPRGAGGVRAEQRGWYVYDWANSAFQTSVVTVFAGPYLGAIAAAAAGEREFVTLIGVPVRATAFYPCLVSLAALLQVLAMPLVGVVADRGPRRRLLGVLAYLGALATLLLSLVPGTAYLLGGILFLVAMVAHGCSTVVYNAFLPEIATPDERDAVSSRGWALGYLGGGILLLGSLLLFRSAEARSLPIDQAAAVRIAIAAAAAWWGAFTVVPLLVLRDRPSVAGTPANMRATPLRQLKVSVDRLRHSPATLRFLAAYLAYSIGVQTVISQAAGFASQELELTQTAIITAVLLVQFVGVAGTWLLGMLVAPLGAKRLVLACLFVWIGVLAYASVLPSGHPGSFYALATLIGLVLGGTQALSRSLFSQMVPHGREASYFSGYELATRGSGWLGALVFGLALQLGAGFRRSILLLVVFFAAGIVLLALTSVRCAMAEARSQGKGRGLTAASHSPN